MTRKRVGNKGEDEAGEMLNPGKGHVDELEMLQTELLDIAETYQWPVFKVVALTSRWVAKMIIDNNLGGASGKDRGWDI
jgi:hypothetical protein